MRNPAPRLIFLAVLAGGLLLWAQWRRPRDLALEVDLTSALPGEIAEVDVVVRRSGNALSRHDVRYGASGAPGTLQLIVHASPGNAEVETTLIYAGKPARRSVEQVRLQAEATATVRPR